MKRFKTEQEILDKIDQFNNEIVSIGAAIDSKEHLADQLRGTEEAYRIEGLRQTVEKMAKQVQWRRARLETLGDRLATFRTPQLAGVDNGDASIPSV